MTEKEIISGVIEEYGDDDYLAGELELPRARDTFRNNQIQFNQNNIDRSGCVYHAGIGTIEDQKPFDAQPYFEKIQDLKVQYGYIYGKGMYIYRGVDMVRELWNKNNPNDTIISYRVGIGYEDFYDALEKGYSIWTGYQGNHDYNDDKRDGVLNGSSFEPKTYGHSIRITKKDGLYVIDNYYQGKAWDEDDNIYKLEDLGILKNNFFRNGYILVFKNEIEKMNNPDIALIEQAIELGITKDISLLEDVRAGKYHSELRNLIRLMRAFNLIKNNEKNI